MADEEILEETQEDIEEDVQLDDEVRENKVEKRIRQLSNKAKLTSNERDELDKANKKLEAERNTAKKEVEFYSAFSDSTDKYPNAKEFKEQIKEKAMSGYSVEDAVVSVLAKEGKLTMPQMTDNPAGGSATNTPMTGEKPLQDMTIEEKRAEVLKSIEKGDISLS